MLRWLTIGDWRLQIKIANLRLQIGGVSIKANRRASIGQDCNHFVNVELTRYLYPLQTVGVTCSQSTTYGKLFGAEPSGIAFAWVSHTRNMDDARAQDNLR